VKPCHIALVGGGNMGRSIAGGLVAAGQDPARLTVSDPRPEAREALAAQLGVRVTDDNQAAAAGAEVVVLAVKPPLVPVVAREIAPALAGRDAVVVSVAAGVRTADLARWLGGAAAVVRAMPNTPALVGAGATALYAPPGVGRPHRERAEAVLRAVGLTLWLEDEALMDAVTALSGSGPAYLFLVMEALEAAGRGLGLPPEQARLLTLQTAYGAAKMALEADEPPEALRRRVTSPGGTTERALAVLEARGLREAFAEALRAARDRSRELAEELARGGTVKGRRNGGRRNGGRAAEERDR